MLLYSYNFKINSSISVEDIEFIQVVFSSLVKSNALIIAFRSGIFFYKCYGSRHEPEYNILNGVVIEEGYVRVTMRV